MMIFHFPTQITFVRKRSLLYLYAYSNANHRASSGKARVSEQLNKSARKGKVGMVVGCLHGQSTMKDPGLGTSGRGLDRKHVIAVFLSSDRQVDDGWEWLDRQTLNNICEWINY